MKEELIFKPLGEQEKLFQKVKRLIDLHPEGTLVKFDDDKIGWLIKAERYDTIYYKYHINECNFKNINNIIRETESSIIELLTQKELKKLQRTLQRKDFIDKIISNINTENIIGMIASIFMFITGVFGIILTMFNINIGIIFGVIFIVISMIKFIAFNSINS